MEFMHYMKLDHEALQVLKNLHGKYRLGVISNFALPECVESIFEKFGLRGFFAAVVVSGAINKRKPNPEIFKKALGILGVSASRAVFVGDAPAMDVMGARNVGMKSILIKRETTPPSDSISIEHEPLEDASIKPDIVIESLTELLKLLEHD
jgi:putative hydrolase of the HAD superfamily